MSENEVLGVREVFCKIKAIVLDRREVPQDDPKKLLEEINRDPVLKRVEKGEINLLSKYQEGLSEKGEKALILVQRALFLLGLLLVDVKYDAKCKTKYTKFNWGLYGDNTISAVKELQELSGITYPQKGFGWEEKRVPPTGSRFGRETLLVLKRALQALAEGKDWRKEIRR